MMSVDLVIAVAIGGMAFFIFALVMICKERPYGKCKFVHIVGMIDGRHDQRKRIADLHVMRPATREAQTQQRMVTNEYPAPLQSQVAGRKR